MECASAPRKTYSVRVENVPEHEHLIFKLIFSVSHMTRGRSHAYVAHGESEGGAPDLIVSGASPTLPAGAANGRYAAVVDIGESSSDLTCIQRPLIATRVLGALDQLVARLLETSPVSAVPASVPEPLDAVSANSPVSDAGPSERDFLMSEEEASELAIVHDEALANPANSEDDQSEQESSGMGVTVRSAAVVSQIPETADPSAGIGATNAPSASTSNEPETQVEVTTQVDSAKRTHRARLLRSLVVDDSASVRKQLELELNYFATQVDYAGTASEAVRLLESNYYDVAFLDVVLPDSDGFQICKRIKATSRSTNVIMLTGKAAQADRVKGALAGCDAYLVKPVGRLTFQGTVKNYLEPLPSERLAGT